MQNLAERDYYTDLSILRDPYEFFDAIREHGPVFRPSNRDYWIITGAQEVLEVVNNSRDFSTAIALQGAAAPLPFTPQGSDISAQIVEHQQEFMGWNLISMYDDDQHRNSRALLNRLFVPSRLKANQDFITAYSDEAVKQVVAEGGCELISRVATPFVTLVIADLLGVPAADRQFFMETIQAAPPAGNMDTATATTTQQPLEVMAKYFINYVTDRRANPREDILSELANAKFPDGTTPDAMEIVRLATFLFGAGQDTSAKLIGNAMRYIVDEPGLQDELRKDPSLIPALLEEVLRLEGSAKVVARLVRRDTTVGGVPLPAGSKLLLSVSAANRDPRRWEEPNRFKLNRPGIREHVAFSRGAHTCVGAPLARAEVRTVMEKFFEHTSHIGIAESKHGPRDKRVYDYEPSFIIRGLSALHITCTPR